MQQFKFSLLFDFYAGLSTSRVFSELPNGSILALHGKIVRETGNYTKMENWLNQEQALRVERYLLCDLHYFPRFYVQFYFCCQGCSKHAALLVVLMVSLGAPLLFKRPAIHWINHHLADSVVCFVNTYPLDSDLTTIT